MTEETGSSRSAGKAARCPICKKEMIARYRPFCSARCADIDLGRWLSGRYAVPARDGDDEAETLRPAESGSDD
ncbi:MAG: DNA gyrase inhibitor YacG [Hyphomicrobiaceae bacterium]